MFTASNWTRLPVIAPLPERLLDRSLPAPGLLAHIVVSKYCDHLPLYRQEQIYAQRHGVPLSRQTLGALGGAGGGLAQADLRTNPHRGDGRRLCAGG